MSFPASRRGFLRDLLALPLIGGGVTLIGAPTAVAEPASRFALRAYASWLQGERARTLAELYPDRRDLIGVDVSNPGFWWHDKKEGAACLLPSTRAALVLSTVGCDWR